jgi:aerobic-type carbon monoxide dehydrogenase small subunit (CoxS/CutS family)
VTEESLNVPTTAEVSTLGISTLDVSTLDVSMTLDIAMTVDSTPLRARVRPRYLLSDFLREHAGVGGVHVACGHGVCGACTVAVDGTAVRACLMLAVQADGTHVQTVASLSELEGETAAARDGLTPLQKAFREHHALQCGYCTPGLLVSTALFLSRHRAAARDGAAADGASPSRACAGRAYPGRAEILDHLNGHLCRCTGYANIIAAIESVMT